MDKLSTKLDKACIPSPHFSKIAEVFSSSQIDEQEAFSPLLTPRKKTTHGGFFASLLFLLLIGTAAGSGWYFGKQGSWSRQPQAPLLSTTLNLDKSTASAAAQFVSEPTNSPAIPISDEVKAYNAANLARLIENYFTFFKKYPWQNDHQPGQADDGYFLAASSKNPIDWLDKLIDEQHGLTPTQAEEINSQGEYTIYKSKGLLKDVFVWVCFYPQSNDYILEAATKCNRNNRLVPFDDGQFIPCHTQDGRVPTKLSGISNLYCVVNDGTTPLFSAGDKISAQRNRDAQRKRDILTIQQSLIAYFQHYQSYPSMEQYIYPGDNNLTPDYLAALPLPPHHPQEEAYLYQPECNLEKLPESDQEVLKCHHYKLCTSAPLEQKHTGNASSNDEQMHFCQGREKCDYYCLSNP